jgi:hypothetical protein
MQTDDLLSIFSFFLPDRTLEFFDVISGEKTGDSIRILLEEKNNPPLEEAYNDLPVESKGFQEITITDFPVRNRTVTLTFRRRRWQVGNELLKRDIHLTAEGTQLEKEFADFLKERSGYEAHCARYDRFGKPTGH